ncbi:hypothetical protein [Crucivirus-212]|nr:hypothetical protein [Crucivirus-212]
MSDKKTKDDYLFEKLMKRYIERENKYNRLKEEIKPILKKEPRYNSYSRPYDNPKSYKVKPLPSYNNYSAEKEYFRTPKPRSYKTRKVDNNAPLDNNNETMLFVDEGMGIRNIGEIV